MKKDEVYYMDSWGRRHATHRNVLKSILEKKRKFNHVLPEVVEIIERHNEKAILKPRRLTVESLSLELFVNPTVIFSILMYLQRAGLIKHEPVDQGQKAPLFPEIKQPWANDRFSILRDVREEDYGQKAKAEETQIPGTVAEDEA